MRAYRFPFIGFPAFINEVGVNIRNPSQRELLAVIFLLSLFMIFSPESVVAEFYKYIDKDGSVFYVDDLSKVPPEYQDQVQVYKEKYDYLPQDQRTAERAKDRERARELEIELQRQLDGELRRQAELEKAQKLRRHQADIEKRAETKVVIDGNRVLVPVLLGNNGIEVKALLLLDTGASQVVLHRNVADQLNIITRKKGLAVVAGGQTIQSEMGILSYLQVGPYTMNDSPVIILPYGGPTTNHNGMLGMNFLRHVRYSIDFENQVIHWIPLQNEAQND
jgi:hypothetical protein